MKRIIFVLLFLTACSGRDAIPENVLPEEKMTEVLLHIHLTEAKVSHFNLRSPDSAKALQYLWENQIFKELKTDSATYKRSYAFYISHPALMEKIYNQLTARLDSMQKSPEKAKL
jgi:Domain of unknown function (DUF4296)